MRLKTYIVEDDPTIRENLIGTLEELARIDAVGTAETENEGKAWLTENSGDWDLAIVDLFLKQGAAWACWPPAGIAPRGRKSWS